MGHETSSVTWKIPLFNLDYNEQERTAVNRVLDRAWLTMGPENQQFEKEFGAFQHSKHCLTVNSCTAALHMAVDAVGVKQGDEIIVPSLTFVATANAVRYAHGTPVFADVISASRPVLDPEATEKLITEKTKAIIVVHYAGYPCDMDAFVKLKEKYGLFLIEDCAHCPGAKWNGRHLGTWGDVGCFSFFSNKNLSMGEGGALLTQSDEYAERFRLMRSHGMTTLTLDRHKGHSFSYDVVAAGYNYRLDEIRAAIGLAQLDKLPQMNARRKRLSDLYKKLLSPLPLDIPFLNYDKAEGVDHIMPVYLDSKIDRTKVMSSMKADAIQTSIHYPAIHRFTDFKNSRTGNLSVTEDLSNRVITLPLYPSMSDEDVACVVASIGKAINDQAGS